MPKTSAKSYTHTRVTEGILATLAFFNLYKLPVSLQRLWELLYKSEAGIQEVAGELNRLIKLDLVVHKDGLYALEDWNQKTYSNNQGEISKRWNRIKKYYWLLSSIPFVEHISVINSMALGNADSESDIDFFIITKPNRLYFARTWVILLFRLLGVYKKKGRINEKFCFGFYVSSNALSIKDILIPDEDPYLNFWMGTMTPILGERMYEKFLKENRWIYSWFPNFKPVLRITKIKELRPSKKLQKALELVLVFPAMALEPALRRIHIRHTYNLPENSWKSSSTVANKNMLKLHALDPRKDLKKRFYEALQRYG